MSDFSVQIDAALPRYRAELDEFLSIRSISTTPESASAVRDCARWVADAMKASGVTQTEIVETKGHPIVLGERIVAEDAPTILLYGHYDV
ncbi:MAG: peptidase M20, partial [Gemmatimonadetes bacterium]|nr:peptidase M20 [Gemmatimonadota bacterium]